MTKSGAVLAFALTASLTACVPPARAADEVVEKACLIKKAEFEAAWEAGPGQIEAERESAGRRWSAAMPKLSTMLYGLLQPYRLYRENRARRPADLATELSKEIEGEARARFLAEMLAIGDRLNSAECPRACPVRQAQTLDSRSREPAAADKAVRFEGDEPSPFYHPDPEISCEFGFWHLKPKEWTSLSMHTRPGDSSVVVLGSRSPSLQEIDPDGRQEFRICAKVRDAKDAMCVNLHPANYLAQADSPEKVAAKLKRELFGLPAIQAKEDGVKERLAAFGCEGTAALPAPVASKPPVNETVEAKRVETGRSTTPPPGPAPAASVIGAL